MCGAGIDATYHLLQIFGMGHLCLTANTQIGIHERLEKDGGLAGEAKVARC